MDTNDIVALLSSRDTTERIRGVKLCRRLPEAERRPLLLKALSDRANYVATQAASALSDCIDQPTAEAMVSRFLWLCEDGLKRDPGCHIRSALANVFAENRVQASADALRIGLKVRLADHAGVGELGIACLTGLVQLIAPDALEHCTLLLFEPNPTTAEYQVAAARALARVADPAAHIPLVLMLTYPRGTEPEVLQQCMLSLVEIEYPRAHELLWRYASHRDTYLSVYAAVMLARIQADGIVDHIRGMLLRLKGDFVDALVLALVAMHSDESVTAIAELRSSASIEIRTTLDRLAPNESESRSA